MLLTDYIKKNSKLDLSALNKEDFRFFDKKVFDDNNKTLKDLLNNPDYKTLIFNKGFMIFSLDYADNDGYDNEIICFINALYKSKDSKVDWNKWVKEFKKSMKLNSCTKILMLTKMNPKFWIENYGFKIKRYEMELEL